MYTYKATATDVDQGDSFTITAPTKPSWLTYNANTGVLSGTPKIMTLEIIKLPASNGQ